MTAQILPILLGSVICCVVPLASFAGGIYYGRFGLPFAVNWRGFGQRPDEDEV